LDFDLTSPLAGVVGGDAAGWGVPVIRRERPVSYS
jgi:hypothetical protein